MRPVVVVLFVALCFALPINAFAQCAGGSCGGAPAAFRSAQPLRNSVRFLRDRKPVRRALGWIFSR